jgi:hypothetical protein
MLIRKTKHKIKNVYWYTTMDKAYQKSGGSLSKYKMMCLYPEEEK